MLSLESNISMAPGYRLQFESVQNSHVLLYPEGLIELNEAAAAIMHVCKKKIRYAEMLTILQTEFDCSDAELIEGDVRSFLEDAYANGWINVL